MTIKKMDQKEILRLIKDQQLNPLEGHALLECLKKGFSINTENSVNEVAIIGMSGRFPDANNVDEFWHNLCNAKASFTKIPNERWNTSFSDDVCDFGAFLNDIDCFDPLFFNISPREAELIDPQQRLFLEESWKALEDAGYASDDLANKKCGLFVGAVETGYQSGLYQKSDLDPQAMWANNTAMIPARIAYLLNLKGPCMTINAACSSALYAIHLACQTIINGECEMMLAGGVCILLDPYFFKTASHANMLSKTGKCRTFDNNADGFVPGEAVGIVVLKSLEAAIKDGDHIYGVIKGSAANHDGKTNGITAPSVASQIEVETAVYENFSIHPETISYIETHGTGTKLGDPIEVEALTQAFQKFTDKKNFCALGSVKTNIGHTLLAAGASSVIKVLLALKYKYLPPLVNFEQENEHLNLKNSPFYINTELKKWEVEHQQARRAAVSGFGLGGTNVHLVIEEYPEDYQVQAAKPFYLIVLSARTENALQRKINDLTEWLEHNHMQSIQDIAYTLLTGRSHFACRMALIVKDKNDLYSKLKPLQMDPTLINQYQTKKLTSAASSNHEINQGEFIIDQLVNDIALTAEDYKEKLISLSKIYLNGLNLTWKKLFTFENYKRISIPTYSFEKEHYWIPAKDFTAFNYEINKKSSNPTSLIFLKPKQIVSASTVDKISFGNKILLLFDNDKTTYQQLANKFQKIFLVYSGSQYKQNNDDSFTINPAFKEDYDKLIDHLKCKNMLPNFFIYNWSKKHTSITQKNLKSELQKGLFSLFFLNQSLMQHKINKSITILFLCTKMPDSNQPQYLALSAFAKTLALENSNYFLRIIEIENSSTQTISVSNIIEQELNQANKSEHGISYKDKERMLNRFEDISSSLETAQNGSTLLKQGGTYLISGGLGGLGLIFAQYLMKKVNANVVLIGRSKLSDDKKIILASLGNTISYYQCDVTKLENLKNLIQKVKQKYGKINGVIHSAGIIRDSFIFKKKLSEIKEVIEPKIEGLLYLDESTKDEELDFFITFSSISAITGNQGQSDYAFSNCFMDHFIQNRECLKTSGKRTGISISINWPLWQEGGMHVSNEIKQLAKDVGIEELPTNLGLQAFEQCLAANLNHIIVYYGQKEKILNSFFTGKEQTIIPQTTDVETFHSSADITQLLQKIFADELKIPLQKIKNDIAFDNFGVDSLVLLRITMKLETTFGTLPKTLLLQYQTVRELADYLVSFKGKPLTLDTELEKIMNNKI